MTKEFKVSVLTLALLLSLPACKKSSEQSSKSNKKTEQVDMFSSIDTDVDFNEESDDNEDLPTFFDFDEDANEFVPSETPEADELEETEEAMVFSWVDAQTDDEFKNVYFGFNKYGISADQKEALNYDIEQVKQLVAEADAQARPTVVVEGHACQEGSPAYNLPLSEKRAKFVADLFVAAGVDKDVIKVVGRGSEVPAVINGKVVDGTREERAANRRVEVRVIYT
jgi:OOP family OmpA-OmpF porin